MQKREEEDEEKEEKRERRRTNEDVKAPKIEKSKETIVSKKYSLYHEHFFYGLSWNFCSI